MTDIVPVPAAPDVPQYPALGSANFNQEAYAVGTAFPGVTYRMWEIAVATHTNATAAKEQAEQARLSAQGAASESDAAMGYRNQAGQSAAAAAQSASQAQSSATTAAETLAEMNDYYLGAKTAPPTTDNQGDPLKVGAFYTQTTGAIGWYWWDGAVWQLGMGDAGSGFMSRIAGAFDGSAAMADAAVQSHNLYAAAAGAHGPDWPVWLDGAGQDVAWVVSTFGDANQSIQQAQLSTAIGVRFERSRAAGVWGEWCRIITDHTFVEKLRSHTVVGGSGASLSVNPSDASIHTVALSTGAMTLNLAAPRQLGDQVTVRITFDGGAWPITFGASIRLPTGVMPSYSAGQSLTLVFASMREGLWDCYYSGVHA